jgi:glycosyltransferase involved in cell wall biosynthesis
MTHKHEPPSPGPQVLAAFVMTYHRPARLANTVQTLLAQSCPPARVLVVDNGRDPETEQLCRQFPASLVCYAAMKENLGPAGAAAYGLKRLADDGYPWIYWGDDDDAPKTVDTLARLMALAQAAGPEVGAVGAVGATWDWRRGRMVRLPDAALHGVLAVDVIAGGSQLIVRRSAIQRAGLPNAQLFFGFEEPEFCLRLRRAGFRLQVDGELMHIYRTMAGRLNLSQPRAPALPGDVDTMWRDYYSTRNYIFAMSKEFGRSDLAWRQSWRTLGKMGLAWRRGLQYGATYSRLQGRALWDGWRSHLGRTVLPQAKR